MPDGEPQTDLKPTFRPLVIDYDRTQGPVIEQESRGEHHVIIRKKPEIRMTPSQAIQLKESAFQALSIANKISPTTDKTVAIYGNDRIVSYADLSGAISQRLIDDEPRSQMAALAHELMESLQEEENFAVKGNNEVLPELVEFLFTGNSRIYIFRDQNIAFFKGGDMDQYCKAWGEVLNILLPGYKEQDPARLFQIALEKRDLPEEQKVNLIQTIIAQARVNKEGESPLPTK